jgi:hypothetical protein
MIEYLKTEEVRRLYHFDIVNWTPNIKVCPICLTKYVPTHGIGKKKCLFCARKLLANKKICLLN